jgi:hypothetical protein
MRKIMDNDSVGNIEDHLPSDKTVKPKRQISDAQREHLNKIRELAMKKKAELKEITLKSKLAKTVPKQDLAKQYDEYVENKVKTKKEEVKKEVEVEEEQEVIIKKPKPKPKKKIVYVEESESEEEEEEVIVKKKTKAKPQTLENLVYNSNRDQLYNRVIEERVRNSIIGYGNALGV